MLGDVNRTLLRFMRQSNIQFEEHTPFERGVSVLSRCHQVMRSQKHFDICTDALHNISRICQVRAHTREAAALQKCQGDLTALEHQLQATLG